MQTKSELRKFAKDFRKTLNIQEVSDKILQIFFDSDIYKNSSNIALYYPFGNELNIKPIFNNDTKKFFIPKINDNDEMFFVEYKLESELIEGKYGISEPALSNEANMQNVDLMIVPALMVDKNGYRLGYGKGYYDKFFHNNKFNGIKVVFVPDNLFTDNLPFDNSDVPVDIIITEKGIFKVK